MLGGSADGAVKIIGKRKAPIWKGKFSAEITDPPEDGTGYTEVIIRDLRIGAKEPRTWKERVQCLKCGSYLE